MVTNELQAEMERWREKAQESGAAYGNANSKHHAELDRANRLERLAGTLAGRAVDLEDRARAAEARVAELLAEIADRESERADLRHRVEKAEAALARVDALADGHNQSGAWVSAEDDDAPAVWVTHLRAALDGYQIVFSTQRTAYIRAALDADQ